MRALIAVSGLVLVATSTTLVTPPAHAADPVDVQLIGTNDFHGRLLPDRDIPGAAKYAGAVDELRAENPNTLFVAAGDLIGATTFESFIADDEPTIDIFNAMHLDVSAVGNHELDQGYGDLVDRVQDRAEWPYISANIDEPGAADEIAPSWTTEVGGVTVGFVGATTEHLPELVNPAGIEGLTVTDIVAATNTEAAKLRADGADLVVLLVHEGAPSTDCATMDDDPTSDFGSIISGVSGDVDAIVSGHTHLNYSCSFPVPAWSGRPVTDRPVVSAGQYGAYLNKLDFTVDPETGAVLSATNQNLDLNTGSYPDDPDVQQIVDQAKAEADVKGAVPLGDIAAPMQRASRPKADGSGVEENRGAESTLGNVVAEAQRWETDAQISFMNPGGLRADMLGPTVTYRQAANVQPFANTLVNMDLTGAQIETVLDQQWQPEGSSRPFLKLGISHGFTYTYDPGTRAITGMWLNGEPVDPAATYSVTVISYLAGGGDNFLEFKNGTHQRDTGKTDLQSMVDYLGELGADQPLPVDYRQNSVGVTSPTGNPLELDLSSLAMTGPGDVHDSSVTASLGRRDLGSFPVDNTVAAGATDDEAGRASVMVALPPGLRGGERTLRITGDQTGTVVRVPIVVRNPLTVRATPSNAVVGRTQVRLTVRLGQRDTRATVRVAGRTMTVRLVDGVGTALLDPFRRTGVKRVVANAAAGDTIYRATTRITVGPER